MTKTTKIIYWIVTLWLALGMFSTGMVQIFQMKEEGSFMTNLGYPDYFLILLGVWKILGVIAVLIPKSPILKEWAYAGFFFTMSGAVFSHIASGSFNEMFPSVLLLVLTILSWYFRPMDRKVILANP